MPLWLFPALMALIVAIFFVSAIWLLLHLPDVARVFRGTDEGEIVPGPTKRRASRRAVWLGLLVFNLSWLTALALWILVIGGDANQAIVSGNS